MRYKLIINWTDYANTIVSDLSPIEASQIGDIYERKANVSEVECVRCYE